jgi:hypothetical protein
MNDARFLAPVCVSAAIAIATAAGAAVDPAVVAERLAVHLVPGSATPAPIALAPLTDW